VYEPSRHLPLSPAPWDPAAARAAIAEIVADAHARFSPERFWPAHPLDEHTREGATTIYLGAAGAIWALDHLARAGVAPARRDFRPLIPALLERNRAEYASFRAYPEHASLLMGDVGVLLLAMRLSPEKAAADTLYGRAEASLGLPALELMWGMPGTMLAALFMSEITGEARWREVFRAQARRLLAELRETKYGPLWVQELYGSVGAYLGPVHGFAGHMLPLLHGWKWLEEAERERIASAIERTLALTAFESEEGVNWPALAATRERPRLVQYCHGAPGIVATFADAPVRTPELDRLLARAGELVWHAGPLAKGGGLCHGTGGNGYAFLKLWRRTGDARWLERARAFAMSAIGQCREARRRYGRGRYTLWTGDLGLAVYLNDCLRADGRFPSVEVF
jgi:hypothetical protein